MHIKFWLESLKRRDHSEGVDDIKMDLREIAWEGVVWMLLVQDGDWWQALVNTVMNLQFHKTMVSC
jgi:hypothetical protein